MSKWLIVSLVGKGQKFFISLTVAKSNQFVAISVGIAGDKFVNLLLTIAVVTGKTSGNHSLVCFQLGTQEFYAMSVLEERFHPYRGTC